MDTIPTTLPFPCTECHNADSARRRYFQPTDTWVIPHPELHTLHIHFGNSTTSEKQSTEETQWLFSTVSDVVTVHPSMHFITLIDTSRADDTESPSDQSQQLYKQMLNMPQNAFTIFYGATPAMGFFITMLTHFSKALSKVRVVKTKEEADNLYREWLQKKNTL